MMSNAAIMADGVATFLNPDTVFSIDLWAGNNAARSVVTGLDMTANAGLTWIKQRTGGNVSHGLYSTLRGATKVIRSDTTAVEATVATGLTAFNNNGFSLGGAGEVNQSGLNYVGWSFLRAAGFFDVVNYVGNGVTNRKIAHSLGVAPGLIIVKITNSTSGWVCYHASQAGKVNSPWGSTAFANDTTIFVNGSTPVAPTATEFTAGINAAINTNTGTYEAYLFAHDPSPSGIIQCGTATPDTPFNLGWTPQFLMIKDPASAGGWYMFDSARGLGTGSMAPLLPTLNSTESGLGNYITTSGTGFTLNSAALGATPYIFVAIRAP